jgi:hypothetical protein
MHAAGGGAVESFLGNSWISSRWGGSGLKSTLEDLLVLAVAT